MVKKLKKKTWKKVGRCLTVNLSQFVSAIESQFVSAIVSQCVSAIVSQFVSAMSQIWRVAPFCESHSITGTPTPTEHYCAKQDVITPILYILYAIHIIWFIIK